MSTSRGRILVVSPWETMWSLDTDGVRAGVSDDHHFVDKLLRDGYELHFLVPESDRTDTGFERVHRHGYPNFFRATQNLPVFMKRFWWPLLFNAIVAPRALRLARKIRPDIVIGHSHYTTLTTWLCKARLGIPSVVKLFGVMDLVHTEWPRWKYIFKNVEQLVAFRFPQEAWIILDDGTRGDEIARNRGIAPEKIHFLPNGLNLEWQQLSHDRAAARERFELSRDGDVVLFLARLVPSKRPNDVIQAAQRIHEHAPGITIALAGDGELRESCERLAADLGVTDAVRFLGVVAHDDIPQLMAAADVFVTTSNLTNMALPTCEALICGVPVIAYDVGDTRKVVMPDKTGVVIPDGDVSALAEAIVALLANKSARSAMSAHAQELARKAFTSWHDRIAMEENIIDGLIRKTGQ